MDHHGHPQRLRQIEGAAAMPTEGIHGVGKGVHLDAHKPKFLHAALDFRLVRLRWQVRIRVSDAAEPPGVTRDQVRNRVVLSLNARQVVLSPRLHQGDINAILRLALQEFGLREVLVEDPVVSKMGMSVNDHQISPVCGLPGAAGSRPTPVRRFVLRFGLVHPLPC
jgi:hypothetical protein